MSYLEKNFLQICVQFRLNYDKAFSSLSRGKNKFIKETATQN